MKTNNEIADTQEEIRMQNLKMLYSDALYWHLIHSGYTIKRAQLAVSIKMNK